jgi:hypothetical protein
MHVLGGPASAAVALDVVLDVETGTGGLAGQTRTRGTLHTAERLDRAEKNSKTTGGVRLEADVRKSGWRTASSDKTTTARRHPTMRSTLLNIGVQTDR